MWDDEQQAKKQKSSLVSVYDIERDLLLLLLLLLLFPISTLHSPAKSEVKCEYGQI